VRETLLSRETALLASKLALDKKAEDVVVMEMTSSGFCDYFVICGAESTRRAQAISDGVVRGLREHGVKVLHVEGEREAMWILLDFGDIVVHVFHKETRKFYDLERLWQGQKPEQTVEHIS